MKNVFTSETRSLWFHDFHSSKLLIRVKTKRFLRTLTPKEVQSNFMKAFAVNLEIRTQFRWPSVSTVRLPMRFFRQGWRRSLRWKTHEGQQWLTTSGNSGVNSSHRKATKTSALNALSWSKPWNLVDLLFQLVLRRERKPSQLWNLITLDFLSTNCKATNWMELAS